MAPLAGDLPVDERLARRGGQEPVHQFDKGGLAAAVGTQQAHDAARLNGKAHVRQRFHAAEALGQVVTF